MLSALPGNVPESAIIPVAHHTAVAVSVRTVTALLGLPVVQACHVGIFLQFGDERFQEACLSGRRVGPVAAGVRVASPEFFGCRMLVACFYYLNLLVREILH